MWLIPLIFEIGAIYFLTSSTHFVFIFKTTNSYGTYIMLSSDEEVFSSVEKSLFSAESVIQY